MGNMKKILLTISIIMVFVLTGCYVPENFTARVDVHKDGSYTMTYEGTMIHVLAIGTRLSAKNERMFASEAQSIARDSEVKHIEYLGRGRYRLSMEVNRGFGQAGYLFGKDIKVISAIPRKDKILQIFVDNMKPKDIHKLKSYGLNIDGKLVVSVPKGMQVLGSNADSKPSIFGLFGDYEWDINSFEKKINILLRPEGDCK